ncbi:MAG TPA: Ig-like domain-containing protein, partial [Cellulomonas sp.]|nr:Ig-like domain-containing protein [Cellulomonas sp.]
PSTATGSVQLYDGTKKLGAAIKLSGGIARTSVTTLSVGSHKVHAVYLGSATFAGSTSSTVSVKVAKAKVTSVKVSGKAFAKGTRPVVTVTVGKLDNGSRAAGKVAVSVNGKKVTTVTLKASRSSVTVRLPKAYSSAVSVKATFTPSSSSVAAKSSSAVKVRVR